MSTFTARTAALLGTAGVPLNTVMTDGIRIEPTPEGYLLRWDGAVKLTAEQASALVAPED